MRRGRNDARVHLNGGCKVLPGIALEQVAERLNRVHDSFYSIIAALFGAGDAMSLKELPGRFDMEITRVHERLCR